MNELIKLLKINDIEKQISGIENIIEQLKSENKVENISNNEDILLIIECLKSINDIRLWNSIWSVMLLLPRNDFLIKYCTETLYDIEENLNQNLSHKRFDYLLSYLFKYAPEKREELLQKFLNSKDISLKFAAAEELANTDITKALIIMMDIYENAIHTYEHDIVDAIDSWIYYEANSDILCELERKMSITKNEKLKSKYNFWMQNIKSNQT